MLTGEAHVGKVVRLHDGLRALYPDSLVFEGVGSREAMLGIDGIRSIRGLRRAAPTKALSIAVSAEGVIIWGESPLLILRVSELAAIGVIDGVMDVTALVAGRTTTLSVPLAVPAESEHIADRIFAALAARSA